MTTSEYCHAGNRTKVMRSKEEAALKAAQIWPRGQVARHIYPCDDCGAWHLTKRSVKYKGSRNQGWPPARTSGVTS